MSPVAPGASTVLPAEAAIAERLLRDGEIIILAVKPSRWFVLLVTWPVLWGAVLAGVVAVVAGRPLVGETTPQTIWSFCAAVVGVRLVLASIQWAGRWYILTNYRLVQVRGLHGPDLVDHELRRIEKTFVHLGATGRLLPAVGTLLFDTVDGENRPPPWLHVSGPEEVERLVDEAIRHARRPGAA
jgi:hypothetical protein